MAIVFSVPSSPPLRTPPPRTGVICVTRSLARPKKVRVNEETSLPTRILFFPIGDDDHARRYAIVSELCRDFLRRVISRDISFCVSYIVGEETKAGSGQGGCDDDRTPNWSKDPGATRFCNLTSRTSRCAQLAISLCLRCMQFIRSYEPWPLCHAKVHNDGTSGLARMRVANYRRLYRVVRLTTALTTFDYYPP